MLSRPEKETLGNSSTDIKAIFDLGSALTMVKTKHGSNLVPCDITILAPWERYEFISSYLPDGITKALSLKRAHFNHRRSSEIGSLSYIYIYESHPIRANIYNLFSFSQCMSQVAFLRKFGVIVASFR